MIQKLKEDNGVLALSIVDQRMPHMTGVEFLTAANSINNVYIK
ncbi:MAG: hypothetical protein WBY28_03500 [Nitrososphaeraceae archaeon]